MTEERKLLERAESIAEEKGRRVLIYSVNAREILRAFFSNDPKTGFVYFPQIDPLPTGFKVLGTQLNWMTNCLDVMVEHHSFDLVPDRELPPNAVGMKTTMKVYKVQEAV